jgi:hypothetical protein
VERRSPQRQEGYYGWTGEHADKASSGILSHTLFVVVGASMEIAMPATSRRIATTQAAIFMQTPQAGLVLGLSHS